MDSNFKTERILLTILHYLRSCSQTFSHHNERFNQTDSIAHRSRPPAHRLPQGEKQDELYLNLVLEYVPETVYSISRHHQKSKIPLPLLYVKLYLYQLSRALAHIHSLGICHRDIKPQNLLVNPENQQLKLCDFGSAKALVKGEPNVSYICSRYYRAPELIFGSTDYSTAIDIWSQGESFTTVMPLY